MGKVHRWAVLLAGGILLFLCACSSAPTSTEVDVPVPVSCVDEVPARPHTYAAAELKVMDVYHLAIALRYNALQIELYAAKLEAAIAGCQVPRSSEQ